MFYIKGWSWTYRRFTRLSILNKENLCGRKRGVKLLWKNIKLV